MKICKYEDYTISMDFLNKLENNLTLVNENSDDKSSNAHQDMFNKIKKDLNLNTKLAFTFGPGIAAFYPIVDNLLNKSKLVCDERTIVLLLIASLSILIIEENELSKEDNETLIKDSKSVLKELDQSFAPNCSIGECDNLNKITNVLKTIKNMLVVIFKHMHLDKIVYNLLDMFAYTWLLLPVMNTINYMMDLYNYDLNNILTNLGSILIGITSIIFRHGISNLLTKIKNKFTDNQADNESDDEVMKDLENFNS